MRPFASAVCGLASLLLIAGGGPAAAGPPPGCGAAPATGEAAVCAAWRAAASVCTREPSFFSASPRWRCTQQPDLSHDFSNAVYGTRCSGGDDGLEVEGVAEPRTPLEVVNFKAEDSFLPGVLEGVVAPHLVTPGSELSQFIRAASAPPRPMPAAFNASYAVRALSEGVAFVLSGGSLLGGSSFSVTVRNSRGAVATCDRTDGFDGTYRVTCPHPGGRLAVHFYLTHVEFGAFVPFADGRVQTDLDHHLVSCVEPPGEPVEPGAGGLDEAWLHTRSAEPQLSPQRVPARTRPNDYPGDVFFVGASHMRFSYDAALQDLGVMQNHSGQVKHADSNETLANGVTLHYLARHYLTSTRSPGLDFVGILEELRARPFPRGALVLIQFGSWDLHAVGLARTVHAAVRELAPLLDELAASSGASFVVLNPPAYPHSYQQGSWAGVRNNHAYAVLAQALALAPGRTFGVFDVARLTRGPLEVPLGGVDWVCADHVTCIREDSQRVGELRVVGPYGFETLHALLAGRFVQHQSRPGA